MKFQVFGCPSCQQPFQVATTQAGQLVECPSCAQTVEIPANAFAEMEQSPPEQPIYACPSCSGRFGVTPEMFGQQVACPHCQISILVQSPETAKPGLVPEIAPDVSMTKAGKKTSKRWKPPANPDARKDLFAPGFEKPKPDTGQQIQPVRRPDEPKVVPGRPPAKPKQSTAKRAATDSTSRTQKSRPKPASDKQSQDVAAPRKRDLVRPPTLAGPTPLAAEPATEEVDSEIVNSEVVDVPDNVPDTGPETESESNLTDGNNRPESIDHLLPPRFDVLDPTRMRQNTGTDQFKVFLPDGKGGTKQVDQRLVRVEHGGEQVSLVALTAKEKRRRRLVQNIIAIVIGIIIMAIAFQLLR